MKIDPSTGEPSAVMDDACRLMDADAALCCRNSKNWIFQLQQASCSSHLPVNLYGTSASLKRELTVIIQMFTQRFIFSV